MQDSGRGYSNAEVVVKLGGWDPNYSKAVAQAVLSALKRLILADKDLPGTLSFMLCSILSCPQMNFEFVVDIK